MKLKIVALTLILTVFLIDCQKSSSKKEEELVSIYQSMSRAIHRESADGRLEALIKLNDELRGSDKDLLLTEWQIVPQEGRKNWAKFFVTHTLSDPYLYVRYEAAITIKTLTKEDGFKEKSDIIEGLKKLLSYPSDIKIISLSVLEDLEDIGGAVDDSVIPQVIFLLHHDEESVRFLAAKALGKIGKGSIDAIEALKDAAENDPSQNVKRMAKSGLSDLSE